MNPIDRATFKSMRNTIHKTTTILILALLCLGCRTTNADKPPNLLFVFPDQMRLHAMGFWKKPGFNKLLRTETDPVVTPNIDRLATKSLVFTQATSTHPLCSPYRGMLMSGMYSSRNGILNTNCRAGRKVGLHHHLKCFTDVLADAGYETAYVGKTHWERTEPLFDKKLNYVGTTEPPGGVYANNYDTYIPPGPGRHSNKFWFQQFVDNHFNALTYSNRPELVGGRKDGQPYRPKRFTPEVEADVVIRYLKNENEEREAGKPFSIFWALNPPHNPYSSTDHCEKDIYDKYYRDMPSKKLMYRKNVRANPARAGSKNTTEKCTPIYYSLITGLDRQLGRVLRVLEKTGEADNTIVVFTADHGEMMGSHGLMGKNNIEDESFLIPFLISYPAKLKPRTDDLLLETVDIMPSLLGMMGLKGEIPDTVDGVDHSVGMISGDYKSCPKPKSALFLSGRSKGVRTDRYTYLVNEAGSAEVIDNIADPYQLKRLKTSAIPTKDLKLLKSELGWRLTRAGDKWAKEKKIPEHIDYSGR